MKPLSISEGVIPIGEVKAHAASYLKNLSGPMVLTQNGRPAGVLLSPADFDQLTERQRFLESVATGLTDADEDRLLDEQELQGRLQSARGRHSEK